MKTKTYITVPSEIQYLNDFIIDNKHFELPNGILNKSVTGVGGTTIALEDNHKTILCSPRVRMLENKAEQYPNTLLIVSKSKDPIKKDIITDYLKTAELPKILVTYDSLHKVLDCIEDFSDWRVVVDEFQCILNDSTFKADTEFKLLKILKTLPYVTYLSATPILDKYIEQIPFFDDINYYELKWENTYKVHIHRKKCNAPLTAINKVICNYQQGHYPLLPLKDGSMLESKEAVIFINSVRNIINIIKNTGLKPEDVNIIVANNEENDKMIKKLGKKFANGKIPLKGEPHKMITLCTSTAYMGVDFYSTTATTFVVSDCIRSHTAIDIATELAQIAGRQRLNSNPFRSHIFFLYNTNIEDISEEEFVDSLNKKEKLTLCEIENNNQSDTILKAKRIKDLKTLNEIEGFNTSYTIYDEETQMFTYNPLAKVADKFMFDVQKLNYKDGIMIRKQLEDTGKFDNIESDSFLTYKRYIQDVITSNAFAENTQAYCEYKSTGDVLDSILADRIIESYPVIKEYFDALGAKKLKALNYNESKIKVEMGKVLGTGAVMLELQKTIKNGDRLTRSDLKNKIAEIYKKLNIKSTAKATDITKFGYQVKECLITNNGKRERGFEIIKY